MLPLIIVLFAAAAALGAVSVAVAAHERATLRRALESIGGYDVGAREEEMLRPFSARFLEPVAARFVALVRRVTPVGYLEAMKRKVVLAGSPPGYEIDRLLVLKVFGLGSGVVWIPLVYRLLELSGLVGLIACGFLWVVSFLGPDLALDRKVAWRQHEIAVRLPDVLDLLVISVEAGLGFDQAVDRTATAVPGPLSEEFRRMLQETRIGAGRADALRALDQRTQVAELRSFILAMLQADTFGVSISRILRTQADEIRIRRRQAAEEQAQRAPVKMLFPLVLCVFPAVFVVVLGPALIELNNHL